MIIGIDLGTTNSAAAVWRDGKSELIPNSLGDFLTPSAVSLTDKGEVIIGLSARERLATHPDHSAAQFKRLMGTQQELKLGKRSFKPEELSALVLSAIKADAEAFTGEAVDEAVITVPAYFNDQQRKATQRAAQIAGLKVDRLLNEPTAAALGYGIHELEQEEPFLVFDLGGGTFDVSIVEIFDGIIEVRSSAGDPRLGGMDFNEVLVGLALDQMSIKIAASERDSAFSGIFREAAERARRALTEADSTTFRAHWRDQVYETEITADAFEERAAPLLNRLREPVLRSLRDGGLRSEELSEIILVGGATRMPIVRRAVTKLFGRFPNHALHPDHAVALGAAVQAGLRSRDAALSEIRMTDVCPFTLGIETTQQDQFGQRHHGVFAPIIERNRTIPTSRVQTFSTVEDNQRQVNINVYQGEARDVSHNVKLGELKVKVPPGPAGTIGIDCRFSYDVSGLLEVDISVPATGEKIQKVFGAEGMDDADLTKRRASLEKLKVHPRDDAQNAAVLARATRCYESLTGGERDYVGELILAFEGVLAKQEPRPIEELREKVIAALDSIEGERYL